MHVRLARQDHVGGQDAVRICKRLNPPHHVGGFLPPLVDQEWGHVYSSPVLGLQRSVVLPDHQFNELLHECRITNSSRFFVQFCYQREMQVSVCCMSCYSRNKAVLSQQRLKIVRTLSKPV